MIYSLRAQPEVNESHIHEVPKNNGLIFHMDEVSVWRKTLVNMFFFVVLKSRPLYRSQKLRKQTSRQEIQNAILLLLVFNMSNCSIVFENCNNSFGKINVALLK